MNDFDTFRTGFPTFFREVNNYRLYLEKLLIEGTIPKDKAIYGATRLLQIQLTNIIKQLTLVERILQ